MESYQIDLLEPKAKQLLKELQAKKLIKMKKLKGSDKFFKTVEKIRNTKARKPTEKEIERAVEEVRTEMYQQGMHS